MKTPDLTLAQLTAVIGWIVAQLVAFGIVDNEQDTILVSVTSTVVAAVWKACDAWIRHGRSRAIAAPPKEPTRDTRV